MKVLNFIRKGKKSHAEVPKTYVKSQSFIPEVVKKEKEIRARFVVTPQTAKVIAPVCTEVRVRDNRGVVFVGTERVAPGSIEPR